MLQRIKELVANGVDFAFETTLSTKSYVPFIKMAQQKGYSVTLLYFWLNSPQLAIDRVAKRVSQGGHNIPEDIITRRYYRGVKNLFDLYIQVSDNWFVINNMGLSPEVVASGLGLLQKTILNADIWESILKQRDDNRRKAKRT